jgi:hypothetical protein
VPLYVAAKMFEFETSLRRTVPSVKLTVAVAAEEEALCLAVELDAASSNIYNSITTARLRFYAESAVSCVYTYKV